MKNQYLKVMIGLLLALSCGFALTGCQSTPEDSSVPWSRPAGWEGQVPGMGSSAP